MFSKMQRTLLDVINNHPKISPRLALLQIIPGVGEVTVLTRLLKIGDPTKFAFIKKAVSYCGLCSAQKESAGKSMRGPVSKKRNKYLQTILIEAAKLAPNWNPQ